MSKSLHYFGPQNPYPKSKKYIPELASCNIKLFSIDNQEKIINNIPSSSIHIYNEQAYQYKSKAYISFTEDGISYEISATIENKYAIILQQNKLKVNSNQIRYRKMLDDIDDADSYIIDYNRIDIEYIVNDINVKKLERCLVKL